MKGTIETLRVLADIGKDRLLLALSDQSPEARQYRHDHGLPPVRYWPAGHRENVFARQGNPGTYVVLVLGEPCPLVVAQRGAARPRFVIDGRVHHRYLQAPELVTGEPNPSRWPRGRG